jgi:hypothetical protein
VFATYHTPSPAKAERILTVNDLRQNLLEYNNKDVVVRGLCVNVSLTESNYSSFSIMDTNHNRLENAPFDKSVSITPCPLNVGEGDWVTVSGHYDAERNTLHLTRVLDHTPAPPIPVTQSQIDVNIERTNRAMGYPSYDTTAPR